MNHLPGAFITRINNHDPIESKQLRLALLKWSVMQITIERVRHILKDPLMIVLLVWALLFLVLGLLTILPDK